MPTKAKVYAQAEMSAPLAHESASPIDWNCELYLKFESERIRAARDLLAQIPRFEAKSVVDVGCGPGNSTELLATAFPAARLIGVENSENMLATARYRVQMAEFVLLNIGSRRAVSTSFLPMARCISSSTIVLFCRT